MQRTRKLDIPNNQSRIALLIKPRGVRNVQISSVDTPAKVVTKKHTVEANHVEPVILTHKALVSHESVHFIDRFFNNILIGREISAGKRVVALDAVFVDRKSVV